MWHLSYTWPQEPLGYDRTAKLAIPHTAAGEKLPVIVDLHGDNYLFSRIWRNVLYVGMGGEGNTHRFSHFMPECIIVAPDGYERSWSAETTTK